MMFDVKMKDTDEILKVFAVQRDKYNLTEFLIYKNNEWKWLSATNFIPVFINFDNLMRSYLPLMVELQKETNKILSNEEGDNNA